MGKAAMRRIGHQYRRPNVRGGVRSALQRDTPELTADEALELLDPALHAQVDRLCVTKVDNEAAEEVWLDLVDDIQGRVLLADLCRVDGLLQAVDGGLVKCLGGWGQRRRTGKISVALFWRARSVHARLCAQRQRY